MSSRAAVQKAHEAAVLSAALAEHNRAFGTALEVLSRPDPPDAVLSDGARTTWLELTDAFYSDAWARHIVGHAAGEPHRPMRQGLYVDMDAQLADRFCNIVLQKAGKASYKPFVQQYGPGILVVGLESPWTDGEDTVAAINQEWAARGNPDISATFEHVYLGFRDNAGNHAVLWRSS